MVSPVKGEGSGEQEMALIPPNNYQKIILTQNEAHSLKDKKHQHG